MSLRDALLSAPISKEPIYADGENIVYARKLTGLDIASAQAAIPEDDATLESMIRFSAKLVLMGCCDANGERVFAESDYDAILAMPHGTLIHLIKGIQQHNGMGDAAKNSSTPSTEGS